MRFPAVESVCADQLAYMAAHDVARAKSDNGRVRDWRLAAWRDRVLQDAKGAYATDLLPALLGGAWKWSDHDVLKMLPQNVRWHVPVYHLMDHGWLYRPVGLRGPVAKQGVAIGLPYATFGERGEISDGAISEAAVWRENGYGIWARPDLSVWYPGWTSLVVIAAGLFGRSDAADFGFREIL